MVKKYFLLVVAILMGSMTTIEAQNGNGPLRIVDTKPDVRVIRRSPCHDEFQQSLENGSLVPSIVLKKEGNILSVELRNYVCDCETEDFEVESFVGEAEDDEPNNVLIKVEPASSYSTDCACPCNLTFTVNDVEENTFFFSCWWYEGVVELTDGISLEIESPVANINNVEVGGIYYNLIAEGWTAEVTSNPNKYTGDVTIPESVVYEGVKYDVTAIGRYAFFSCSGLTSITIPNSVTSIGGAAFNGCRGLTSVTIPNSVTSIGDDAFAGCRGLTSITIPGSVTSIGDCAFSGCSGLTSVTIPNSVTNIGKGAFFSCSGLTSVTIPNSLISIGELVFFNCHSLDSVTIGNSVTSIGRGAFSGCSGLTSVTIPNSVTSIGNAAFGDCSSLSSIAIGIGVETIDSLAFANCPELTEVYCYAEAVPSTGADAFENSKIGNVTLHVPAASVSDYEAADPWNLFKSIVPIETQGLTVSEVQISSCEDSWMGSYVDKPTPTIILTKDGSILSVEILNYVSNCATSYFNVKSNVTDGIGSASCTVTLNVNPVTPHIITSCECPFNVSFTVHDIAANSFYLNCWWYHGLVELTEGEQLVMEFMENAVEIDGIYYNLISGGKVAVVTRNQNRYTGDVSIPESVVYEGVKYSVTSIKESAFNSCTNLTSVTIPNSVTFIGGSAFNGCI